MSDMKPKSVEEYVRNHVVQAENSLSNHVILHHEQYDRVGIVEVGTPNGSSIHRCEITFITFSGHLVVTGDHDTMCFARYRGPNRVSAAIAWMARNDLFGYVKEKALIGMGSVGVENWCAEVALDHALEYQTDAVIENDKSEIDLWEEIVSMIEDGDSQHNVQEHIYNHDGDSERLDLGMVPSDRLLWAWSIVRKANQLLRVDTVKK